MNKNLEYIVVGAGIAGLGVAYELQKAGKERFWYWKVKKWQAGECLHKCLRISQLI